jgi:hypothetical protein
MESNTSTFPIIDDEGGSVFDIPNHTGTPERRLLTAILERAILDYVGNDSQEVKEAEEWLFTVMSEHNADPFSFLWVCRELDLSPEFISSRIKAMPKRGKSRIAPWYIAKASA